MKNSIFITIVLFLSLLYGCSANDHENHDDQVQTPAHDDTMEAGLNISEAEEHENHLDTSMIKVITLRKQPFAFVLKTGGTIIGDNKDIVVLSSKTAGVVRFRENPLYPGVKVVRGQALFLISGEQLAGENTDLRYRQIKSDLERASANFERAGKLITDRIITEEQFLEAKNEYQKILNEFNELSPSYGDGGNTFRSEANGYISEVFVREGQRVMPGDPLLKILKEGSLILKANVPPVDPEILSSVGEASFRVAYNDRLFNTREMGGQKISYGKSTEGNSFHVPVYFRIDYDPRLIEGTYAEVWLKDRETEDTIVVPNTALMEEFGKMYVYTRDSDGDFVKRYITTGYSDGENTLVTSGLAESESIVASGAYAVKLSQTSSSAPAHNHAH